MGPSASGVQRSIPSSARWLTSPRRCPNASAAVMGRRKRAGVMRTGRGKISTERASGSSRGADMPRWIASSSSLRRRTWGTRNSVAGWMTPLTTLAFLMLGTPLTHVGRQGVDPAVAPRRHCWTTAERALNVHHPSYRKKIHRKIKNLLFLDPKVFLGALGGPRFLPTSFFWTPIFHCSQGGSFRISVGPWVFGIFCFLVNTELTFAFFLGFNNSSKK